MLLYNYYYYYLFVCSCKYSSTMYLVHISPLTITLRAGKRGQRQRREGVGMGFVRDCCVREGERELHCSILCLQHSEPVNIDTCIKSVPRE